MEGEALTARAVALDPPRAHGAPAAQGVLREEPEDFVVEEDLGFAPAGSGAHLLLKVRKRNANTQWVARELARAAGCRPREVGYAGLKDRRAVAVQWFSVPRSRASTDWQRVRSADFEVLEAHPHTRKLPRGALAGNTFAVRIAAPGGDGAALAALIAPRLVQIARCGVPNYFGPQRFGRGGANLAPVEPGSGSLTRQQRGFAISGARSVVFNALLAERVREGSWDRLLNGDLANLDGRGSIFAADTRDASLVPRCERLEIHPTGPLWGQGGPASGGRVLELELCVAARFAAESALCIAAGMRQERRSLRLTVRQLQCEPEAHAVRLRFRLTRGGFATAVLRELIESPAAPTEPQSVASST
jgi:tRNA pseudouridine13 synthase